MCHFVADSELNAKPTCESALQPPVRRSHRRRMERRGDPSWWRANLPLSQLREGRGNAPSQGDVIEAEIPDASGRAVGKVMLEALEVSPAQKSGIFARVACTGVVDMELADYAVQVLGMGKERKEFVFHLCTPQEPGRCEETGAALHCGKWSVVPGEADRGVGGASVETSERTDKGLRPEIAEAGPALFAPMDGEGLGAQVATLVGELGLDPPARPMERKSLSAPRSHHLGSRYGDRSPRAGVREPNGRKEGRGESNVEAYASVARVLDSSGRESATCSSPRRCTCGGITRKAERGAGAFRAKAPRPEMVARSVGGEGTRIDCRRIGNGGTGQSRPGREFRRHGEEEPTRARTRGHEKRELVLKRRNGGVQQHPRGPGERRRFQGETDRRLEAGSATSLRAGNDAPPPGATSRGLRDGRRSAGERSGGCLSLDCSEAECREQVRVQEHSRIAVFSGSRGSADAWTSGECRRRPDPEIPRSGSGGTGGRGMVTRTSSRTARSSSVDSVIWSSGSDDQSRAGFLPIAPEPEDTESQAKARGGRAAPGPPPSLEERGRRRRTQSRSAEDPGGKKIEKERPPHETSKGGTKPEEGKARAKENEASS